MIHNSIKAIASTVRDFGLASPVRCLIHSMCHIKIKYKFLCLTCEGPFLFQWQDMGGGCFHSVWVLGGRDASVHKQVRLPVLKTENKKNHQQDQSRERASYIAARNQDKPMFKTLHPRDSDIRFCSDLNSLNSLCDKKLLVVARSLLVLSWVCLRCC